MKIKDNQLQAILAEVEAEIGSLLKSEQEKLSKAVNPDEDPSKEKSPASPEASASAPADEGSAPAEGSAPPAEGSAPPMGEPDGDEGMGAPAPGAPAPSADPAAAGPMDPQALQAEYEALPPEELQMHLMAAQAAAQKLLAGAGAGGPEGSAPPAAPPAPPAGPEASAPPAPAMKMELNAIAPKGKDTDAGPDRLADVAPTAKKELNINNKGNGGTMKSEVVETSLVKAQQDEIDALKAQMATMAKALELMTETPVRKAITSLDAVKKSEAAPSAKSLSKAEVTEKLKQISSNPNLSKSARQTINDFYDGKISIDNLNLDGLK